jgi:hypothetical protein
MKLAARLSARLAALAVVGLALVAWGPNVRSQSPGPASGPTPTPAPPIVVPTPTPSPLPAPSPSPPPSPLPDPISLPIAAIDGPKQTAGTFMLIVKSDPTARNTWRNVLPEAASPPIELELKDGRTMLWFQEPPAGVYLFRLRSQLPAAGLDPIADVEHVVTVGRLPPIPVPTPTPTPPGPPVVEGARHVMVVYETADVTPAFARLLNGLRSGANARYFADRKHALSLIDDDAVNSDGGKAALLAKYAESVKFPRSLIVTDGVTGAVIAIGELTEASTAAGVIEFVKQNGG